MGMFDYIKLETKCPKCRAKVDTFQSKDGQCQMETLDYWEVDNFYTDCDKCGAWIEYNRRMPVRVKIPLSKYKRTVRGTTGGIK